MSERKYVKNANLYILSSRDTKGTRTFTRRLKKTIAQLRKIYADSQEREDGPYEWLRDNFHILYREARNTISLLEERVYLPVSDSGVPQFYLYLRECVFSLTETITEKEIDQMLRDASDRRSLTIYELNCLSLLLKAAFVSLALDAFSRGDDEKACLAMSVAVRSINLMSDMDFEGITERHSAVEAILRLDDAYSTQDEGTRLFYRNNLARMSILTKTDEITLSKDILNRCSRSENERERHVGYYLTDKADIRMPARAKGFIAMLELGSVALSLALSLLLGHIWLLPFLLIPVREILRPVAEVLFMNSVKVTKLPRIELSEGIPEEETTAVVVSTLLPSADKARTLSDRLEELYHSNGGKGIIFCILADLKGADKPSAASDKPAVDAACKAVRSINRKYGQHFILMIRERTYSPTEGNYTGRERKRGAIEDLIRFIKGRDMPLCAYEGSLERLHKVRHMLCLDSDTQLPIGAAAELVGTAIHPLNKPILDKSGKRVTAGFGILAPRIGVDLESAGQTPFSRVMSGTRGVSAYDISAGDMWQDLFGEGIFAGKGLINVDAFYSVLDGELPEERVLSHDFLEGSYLRTAYVSNVELSDAVPSRMSSYLSRLHRWIRGDWQNSRWLFIKRSDGKPALGATAKYKLICNLLSSLKEAAAVALLLCSLFLSEEYASVLCVTALFSVVSPLLVSVVRSLFSKGGSSRRRYYSRVMGDTAAQITQAGFLLFMLVQRAVISIDAIVRSLYRQLISKKKLLEWRTAADSEGRQGRSERATQYLFAELISLLFLLFSPSVLLRTVGLIFLLLPVFDSVTGKKSGELSTSLSEKERQRLTLYAESMWRYFEEFGKKEDNFLVPDNVQFAPVYRIAHRTSPTNIGLQLLSVLTARDFGFIDTDTMIAKTERIITTVERMEKWNGNLYNWYDTKTLAVLTPRYVSAVDSGNFVVSLVALRQGLTDYYVPSSLCERIERLIDRTDLSPMYNKRRKLFHIGFDVERQELSGSFYDLLMSEARAMSYFAIAMRQISPKHWGALGRTLSKQGGYAGAVSWTGTMFEYTMPHIWLPVYEGTFAYESIRFALRCQRINAQERGIPWGISESGYYEFDRDLNYKYKAHGIQRLGLKRGLSKDAVVSPYSSFLALPYIPHSALRNLQRIESMTGEGMCGFYEALDFTPDRRGESVSVVNSYMAHHVGMSIVSAGACLFDNPMQRRFMSDKRMAAANALLQEKIPLGAIIFEDIVHREVPQKPVRSEPQTEQFTNSSPDSPRLHMLTNGCYSVIAADSGAGVSMSGGVDINTFSGDMLMNPQGVFVFVRDGEERFSITAAPDWSDGGRARITKFNADSISYSAAGREISAEMTVSVDAFAACERRRVTVENKSDKDKIINLSYMFTPCLMNRRDYASHPAFGAIFVTSHYSRRHKAIILKRRPRSGGNDVVLAVGFGDSAEFTSSADKESLLTPFADGREVVRCATEPIRENRTAGGSLFFGTLELICPAKSKVQKTLIMCLSNDEKEAVNMLILARTAQLCGRERNGSALMLKNSMESGYAAKILLNAVFPPAKSRFAAPSDIKGHLWSMGISGDKPIVMLRIIQKEGQKLSTHIEMLKTILTVRAKLLLSGVDTDLAVVFAEGGDYRAELFKGMDKVIAQKGDSRGIFLIDSLRVPPEAIAAVTMAAVCIFPFDDSGEAARLFMPSAITPCERRGKFEGEKICFASVGEGTIAITETPPRPWSICLANSFFGTYISYGALGYTWCSNSRENKLTPWYNDVIRGNNGERILLRANGRLYDLALGAVMVVSPTKVSFVGRAAGVDTEVTVSVPERGAVKDISVKLMCKGDETPPDLCVVYYTEPLMEVARESSRFVTARKERKGGRNLLLLQNSANVSVGGSMFLTSRSHRVRFSFDRSRILSGDCSSTEIPASGVPCACVIADIVGEQSGGGREHNVNFRMGFSSYERGAFALCDMDLPEMTLPKVEEGEKFKNPLDREMVSHWLLQQTLFCRFRGRTALFQCGGAWGYRDQLQDVCALIGTHPNLVRAHIIRCAAHQFEQGDVLHWWHPLPTGDKGVRSRCSDDMLWLVYAVCEYTEKTGDMSVLNVPVYYIHANLLAEGEHERYCQPIRSNIREDVYNHCIRALEKGYSRGKHGLILMGGGDWNDGMNRVGENGVGESVWLSMFYAYLCERFIKICRSDTAAKILIERADDLRSSIDTYAWDGEWYMRAFYDDGRPLGSRDSEECKIDILPQAFAVLCGMPDKERVESALTSALEKLVDWDNGIAALFTPPFDKEQEAGYIAAYPKGLRENGGQYTHAAIWLALACFKFGKEKEGRKLLELLNPMNRFRDRQKAEVFRNEPYYVTADIGTNEHFYGRGGWSGYTGSASWLLRLMKEYGGDE
ncbi:MAG: hypothetical protein LBL82_07210 [Oscillospiraceae bacterium]|nr:hypothetical protein [Oscillospiraceae bacterium]